MTDTPDFGAIFNILGHLSLNEAKLLFHMAAQVPVGGTVVEIGSFQGRSTVCLGFGAKMAGAFVWSIDPHYDYQVTQETHYGMENHAALLKNLIDFGLADVVRVVALNSHFISWGDNPRIDVLFIDGSHEYEDVKLDFMLWSPWMQPNGKIIVHDSSGLFADVTRALNEFLAAGKWIICEQVDATTVLRRVE